MEGERGFAILAPGRDAKTEIPVECCCVVEEMVRGTALPNFVPDRVVPAAGGDPVDLWVYAVLPKKGWVPHSPGDLIRADHAGSAIMYRDQVYELMRVEETLEGGYAYRYGLRPWDPQYVMGHVVNYTLKSQMDAAVAHEDMTRVQALRYLILWLFPIAGFAPDPLQREWEKKTGLSMAWVSAGSALFGLALAFVLRGASEDPRFTTAVLYLALESFARLLWINSSHKPRGSPLLTLPYRLWQGMKRGPSPAPTHDADAALLTRQDEVRRIPNRNSLQICSWYFDATLVGSTPVLFEGNLYMPTGWHREGKGLSRRWLFELEKVEPQAGVPSREYTRPRTPDQQKAVEDFTHRLDMAESFALVWGIYPRADQLRLQHLYQYQGPRSTAITAGLFLVIGVLQLCLNAALYRVTILALIGPAYLTIESVYRLYRAKAVSEPAGSIFGYLLRLAIRPPK
jgi:hypothetical protein